MIALILLIGVLFLGLVIRLAEGVLRIVLILIVIGCILLSSLFSSPAPSAPSASVEPQRLADIA